MKTIKFFISSTAILPGLLMSTAMNVQSFAANPQVSGAFQLAQTTPTAAEEEKRRKQDEERKQEQERKQREPESREHQPAGTPPHQGNPPAGQPNVAPHPAPTPPVAPPAPVHAAPPPPVEPPKAVPNAVQHPAPAVPTPNAVPAAPPAPVHAAPPVVQPTTPPVIPQHAAPAAPAPNTEPATPPAPTHIVPQPPVMPNQGQIRPQGTPVAPVGTPQHPPAPANQPVTAIHGPSTMAPQFPVQQQQPQQGAQPKRTGITPLEGAAVGAAAGIVGGMIIGHEVHRMEDVQSSRQTVEQNGATFYSEPGRLIVREGDGLYVRHDETARFREFGSDAHVEQRGDTIVQTVDRPDHSQIITITDRNGELLKRIRRLPNGSEIVLIDNTFRPRPQHFNDEVVIIDAPTIDLPPDRYDVDASRADENEIYETLIAPPVAHLARRYTLDEVRYSRDLRQYVRSVDLTTITFDTGSWTPGDGDVGRLQGVADAINRAVRANPNEIFLIEGHTDAVGNDVDNLSLSDRRAQAVAGILTRNFNVPPENLTTQGYGSQFLKVQTDGAERANRRVTIRRITPFLAGR